MNIYILTEITKRELDSNLLLSVLAANQEHEVLVTNMTSLKFLNDKKILKPGVFHTKSLVHDEAKQKFHLSLKKNNMLITSLDEENGLVRKDLKIFAEQRFSNESLSVVDKVFCWGSHDFKYLRDKYPKYLSKFSLTGSPRVDMWQKKFLPYWTNNKKINREEVLIAMNFALVNGFETTEKIYKKMKLSGYFERSKGTEQEFLKYIEESKKFFLEFIDIINFLSTEFSETKFVVRPHPREKISTWESNIKKNKNIRIDNSGNFNQVLSFSKLIIHSGSTTSFYAAVNKVPIISFVPITSDLSYGQIANELGKICKNKEEVKMEIENVFNNKSVIDNEKVEKIINFKIHFPKKLLSAESIVNIWEELDSKINSKKNNFIKIKILLFYLDIKTKIKQILFQIYKPNKKKILDNKFELLDYQTIKKKINLLCKILNIKDHIDIKIISEKCFLIKKIK